MAKKDFSKSVNGVASVASTKCINDQQWTKYHTKGGHGFAAEDANAMADKWCGKHVDKVGVNNAKNGADRIVNGVEIQTKYCLSASASIDAAFDNGVYRYPGQVIEVPKDQYGDAVRIMRGRISEGQVPGVTDPNMAERLVIKGHYTYDEAVRIARAGNDAFARTASFITGKLVACANAANTLTKAARTNALVSTVVFVGTTIPDAVDLCRGKMIAERSSDMVIHAKNSD